MALYGDRRLERAQQTVVLLRHTLVYGAADNGTVSLLKPVLGSLESRIVYKRYYRSGYQLDKGLELLLFDRENPRSVNFQLEALRQHLEAIAEATHSARVTDDMRSVLKTLNHLLLASVEELSTFDAEADEFSALANWLEELEEDLKAVSQSVADRYFDHTSGPQPVDMGGMETL